MEGREESSLINRESGEWNSLWKLHVPSKIKVFAWLLLADRVNTRNMLKRRHYNIGNNVNCAICSCNVEETVEHLFFNCPFSQTCWNAIDISWPDSGNRLQLIRDGRQCWTSPLFMEIFMLSAWSIWKERNGIVIKGIPPTFNSWRARLKNDLDLLCHRGKPPLVEFISAFLQTNCNPPPYSHS